MIPVLVSTEDPRVPDRAKGKDLALLRLREQLARRRVDLRAGAGPAGRGNGTGAAAASPGAG